ncbi:MAG: MerR family transcriptional regulator [Gemmatimonadetes bacterium]|nr:MerR family transcriptional regulator [Gemmatimonadota bacterium]
MSKLYYSSSEVSTMLDLEPSVLRFWEDQFGQLRIKRNRAGKRMYREKDIELIRAIKQLTRDEGYTIAGARKKLQESAADRAAAKADRGAEQTGRTAEKADPTAAKVDRTTEKADRDAERRAPPESASESEVIQWIRSRLIDMREMMD